jgi:hypothetical protein
MWEVPVVLSNSSASRNARANFDAMTAAASDSPAIIECTSRLMAVKNSRDMRENADRFRRLLRKVAEDRLSDVMTDILRTDISPVMNANELASRAET